MDEISTTQWVFKMISLVLLDALISMFFSIAGFFLPTPGVYIVTELSQRSGEQNNFSFLWLCMGINFAFCFVMLFVIYVLLKRHTARRKRAHQSI